MQYLHEASQEQVFSECGEGLVPHVLDGYNATLMAYGQTGAGKTYTMTGSSGHFDERGVIPRAVSQLFKEIAARPELNISIRYSVEYRMIFIVIAFFFCLFSECPIWRFTMTTSMIYCLILQLAPENSQGLHQLTHTLSVR